MGKPELSVIVPIYNVERYLRQCIDSILNQSMQEIEVILVDDGSPDGCGSICDEYAQRDPRVKVIHQENRGALQARWSGVLESTCEYITFVDGDDFIDPVSYALAEKAIENNLDIIIFGITRYYAEWDQRTEYCRYSAGVYHKQRIEQEIWPDMIWNLKENCTGLYGSLCNKLFKRELLLDVYRKVGDDNFYNGEDQALLFSMMKHADSAEIIHKSYYYYRQRGDATSPSPAITDPDYFEKAYQRYVFLKNEFQGDENFIRQIEYDYMAHVLTRRRKYGEPVHSMKNIFPFDRVDKGDRIVLYGAGAVGQTYMSQLKMLDYCQVILWVDRNCENHAEKGVVPVERIRTVPYDKVVIAIKNSSARNSAAQDLLLMGVEPFRIVK